MSLQGTIDPRVNGGYRVYDDAFLKPSSDCSSTLKQTLQSTIASQIPILEIALEILGRVISLQLQPLHNALVEAFRIMKNDVETRYGKCESFVPSKKVRCLRKIVDPEAQSMESNSSSDIRPKETPNRRARPASWMESCNTLASSNYGGSEQSLAERGRRRRSKPTEWFHSFIGSQKNLTKLDSTAINEKAEIILREKVTNMRPRRPCSLPRSPKVSLQVSPKNIPSLHVPCIKV